MKKHPLLPTLLFLLLLVSLGTAQASPSNQVNSLDSAASSSIYPLNRWKSDYIQSDGDVGSYISITLDPDHNQAPWVSYFDATTGSLNVAHYTGYFGGNCGPALTWYCEVVDSANGEVKGWFTSIDVVPDTDPDPEISTWAVGVTYYDDTFRSLKFAQYRCELPNPCAWTISTVDNPAVEGDRVGYDTSLKFDSSGTPHMVYYAEVNSTTLLAQYGVKYAYFMGSGTGNCGDSNDWHCEFVDFSFVPIGEYPSLDIDWEGKVHIAYYDGLSQSLKYAYYGGFGNCGTDNAWVCSTIDDTGNTGLFPSLHAPHFSGDEIKIAYYDADNGRLMYAVGPRLTGNCGPSNSYYCVYVDNMGVNLSWASISLKIDQNNQPVIAYTDAEEFLLPLGLKVAGPSVVPPWYTCDGALPDWQCGRVDNGDEYRDAGRYAALAVKNNGLAVIAYSETNTLDDPVTNDLKLAFQQIWSFLPMTMK